MPSLREYGTKYANRSMVVRNLKVLPLEVIVRGYLFGSAWQSYKSNGKVNGKVLPKGLREAERLPEPIYTPSTKAPVGQHDENISREEAARIVGEKTARRVEELVLRIYEVASEYAYERGIIIADTKFKFGIEEDSGEVVLVDEVLTPDSSRFWERVGYEPGRAQRSFDKQALRDWLVEKGLAGKGVEMPREVVEVTRGKYEEAFRVLTGKSLEEALR